MSIRVLEAALRRLELQRAEKQAADAAGGVLFLPPNGRGDDIAGPRLRLFDPERRKAASDAGANELVALESALID